MCVLFGIILKIHITHRNTQTWCGINLYWRALNEFSFVAQLGSYMCVTEIILGLEKLR